MFHKFITKTAMVLAAMSVVGSTAVAQTGSRLNLTGSARISDPSGGGGPNLLIDFLTGIPDPITPGLAPGNVTATQVISGVFVGTVPTGTFGTILDLTANATTFQGIVIPSFIQIAGYTFDIRSAASGNTFGPINLTQVGSSTIASFEVKGLVTGPGLGGVPYQYTGAFSAQFSDRTPAQVFNDINTGRTLPVGFSAELVIGNVVPEPSTYALMGAGLAALGLVARRRRTRLA